MLATAAKPSHMPRVPIDDFIDFWRLYYFSDFRFHLAIFDFPTFFPTFSHCFIFFPVVSCPFLNFRCFSPLRSFIFFSVSFPVVSCPFLNFRCFSPFRSFTFFSVSFHMLFFFFMRLPRSSARLHVSSLNSFSLSCQRITYTPLRWLGTVWPSLCCSRRYAVNFLKQLRIATVLVLVSVLRTDRSRRAVTDPWWKSNSLCDMAVTGPLKSISLHCASWSNTYVVSACILFARLHIYFQGFIL